MTAVRWIRAGLLLIAILVGAELAIGRWIQSPSRSVPDPRFGVLQQPGARFVQSSEGHSVSRVNSWGRFDDEPREPRPAHEVLLVGDSYSEALQVDRRESFPWLLEHRLRSDGLDAEVFNAAQSGAHPAMYPRMIAAYRRSLRPDLVIVQVNDGDIPELGNPRLLAEARALDPDARPGARSPARSESFLRRMARSSALLKYTSVRLELLRQRESSRLRSKLGLVPPDTGVVAQDQAHALPPRAAAIADSLAAEMRRLAPRIVLLYIPRVDYFVPTPGPAFPERREFWRSFAARAGFTLVDPTEAILADYARTREPLHGFTNSTLGGGHVNALGHRVIADLLEPVIQAELQR